MLVSAIHACERYYPAFQFVVWAGKSATDAMSAAMFDLQRRGVGAAPGPCRLGSRIEVSSPRTRGAMLPCSRAFQAKCL